MHVLLRSNTPKEGTVTLTTMSQQKPFDGAGSLETNRKRLRTSEVQQEFKKQRNEEEARPRTFDNLPDELVSKIFSYVSTSDLLTKVARVSKKFHRISQDSDAHVAVQMLDLDQVTQIQLLDFLEGKKNIQEVEMDSEWYQPVFELAVMDQKKTTSLSLLYFNYEAALKLLVESPQKARQIQTLRLHGNEFGDLSSVVPEFANLIEFELWHGYLFNHGTNEEEAAKIAVAIAMKSLRLESFTCDLSLETDQLKKLLDRHGSRLKTLSLPYTKPSASIKEQISKLKFECLIFYEDYSSFFEDGEDDEDNEDDDDDEDDEDDEDNEDDDDDD